MRLMMMRSLTLALTGALLVALTTPAVAQEESTTYIGDFGFSSTSTTTIAGVLITVGPILTTTLRGARATVMEDYLRQNNVALHQEIPMGGGDTVADLGQLFQVDADQRAAFGELMRANRGLLLDLAEPSKLNEQRAALFMEAIIIAMEADERFEPSLKRLASQRG